jgi:hypothetical protein
VLRSRGHATLYASWNGATEVDRWQLLAGSRPGELRPVTAARTRGFETALHSPDPAPRFAVRALDRNGVTLGSSAEVAVAA